MRSPGEIRRSNRESWTLMLKGLTRKSPHLAAEDDGRRPSKTKWLSNTGEGKCPALLLLCLAFY